MSLIITSLSPVDGASNVAIDSVLYVAFNENIAVSSLTELNFNLVQSNRMLPISATIDYYVDEDGVTDQTQVAITPNNPLFKSTGYRLIITGGSQGVLAEDNDYLANGFILDFQTGTTSQEPTSPSAIVAESDAYIGGELILVRSTPVDGEMEVAGDTVKLIFNQGLPDEYTLVSNAKHPLGIPLAATDPFIATIAESGARKTITITSNDGSPVSFSDNIIYRFSIEVDNLMGVPQIEFMTQLDPYYSSVEEIRLDYGGASDELSDFKLALLLFRSSLHAQNVWSGGGGNIEVPTPTPYYVKKYVEARTVLGLIKDVRRNARGTGARRKTLGDMTLVLQKTDPESIVEMEGYVQALYALVSAGNTSSVPLSDSPGYVKMAPRAAVGTVGKNLVDDTTQRGSVVNRDIGLHTTKAVNDIPEGAEVGSIDFSD